MPREEKNINEGTLALFDQNREFTRSELNLEKNAVFTVSAYKGLSREIIFRQQDDKGLVHEHRVIIGKTIDGHELGVLTVYHFKIYLVLLELWEKAGKPIHDPVHFTVRQILTRLESPVGGNDYQHVKKVLYNLRQIPIEFRDSFFDPRRGEFKSLKPFSVLSHLEIYERKYNVSDGEETRVMGYGEFQFSRHILESLLSNYSHPVILDVVKEFKKHQELAILLYVYVDRNLAFKNQYEVTLDKLFDHLDLSQKQIRYPADRKVKIKPVLSELKGKPLSSGTLTEARIVPTEDRTNYKAIFQKNPYPALPRDIQKPKEESLPSPEHKIKQILDAEFIAKLSKLGLSQSQIDRVVARYPRDKIIDWLNSQRYWKKKAENPAAFFLKALEGDWVLPNEYFKHKGAKHFVLWQCSHYPDCTNSQKVISSPKEQSPKASDLCPQCKHTIKILDPDRIEYQN